MYQYNSSNQTVEDWEQKGSRQIKGSTGSFALKSHIVCGVRYLCLCQQRQKTKQYDVCPHAILLIADGSLAGFAAAVCDSHFQG